MFNLCDNLFIFSKTKFLLFGLYSILEIRKYHRCIYAEIINRGDMIRQKEIGAGKVGVKRCPVHTETEVNYSYIKAKKKYLCSIGQSCLFMMLPQCLCVCVRAFTYSTLKYQVKFCGVFMGSSCLYDKFPGGHRCPLITQKLICPVLYLSGVSVLFNASTESPGFIAFCSS